MTPTALIIRTAGTNCDRELAHAFHLAGAETRTVHLNELIAQPALLDETNLVGVPGGFSYGDDIAAGRIFANRLRQHLLEPFQAAIARGVPMIGPCNGFQVMAKMGLLPEPTGVQVVTLAENTCGRFMDKWVPVETVPESVCIWTKGLDRYELPVAHGEGRFVVRDEAVLERLKANGQIALRYQHPFNPNGSTDDIAGICDPTGLVLGLMPHPERYIDATNHPTWTRRGDDFLRMTPPGLRYFQNAVEHVKARQAVGSVG